MCSALMSNFVLLWIGLKVLAMGQTILFEAAVLRCWEEVEGLIPGYSFLSWFLRSWRPTGGRKVLTGRQAGKMIRTGEK